MIKRRHLTGLSDDALILFDALWDGDCALWMLQRHHYQAVTQHPYRHDLDNDALLATLDSLAAQGLVRAYLYVYAETDDRRYYGLTPEGGALWELERKPNWERYCYSSVRDDIWSVEAVSLETAYAYAMWAYEAGWGAPPRDHLQVVENRTYRFLPWKDFASVYSLRGSCQAETYRLDWDAYQARRSWWQDIPELLDM